MAKWQLKEMIMYTQLNINKISSVDVFGNKFLKTKVCPCCEQEKLISEFYSSSTKSKLAAEYKPRSLCKTCYCKTNGKYLKEKDTTESFDLSFFF